MRMSESAARPRNGCPRGGLPSQGAGHHPGSAAVPGLEAQAAPPRLQVLLTGKPCRNFQVLVAYSMLQMVREQVLQESMLSNDIILVSPPTRGPTLRRPSLCLPPPHPQELCCPEHSVGTYSEQPIEATQQVLCRGT